MTASTRRAAEGPGVAADADAAPHPVRFAVASVGRSGSTLLERLLDSHPRAVCRSELLAPRRMADRANGRDDIAAYLREELLDPASLLPDVRAVGFKAMWEHGSDHPALWDALAVLGFRLVLNTRPNKLDQFISMRLAQITLGDDWFSRVPYPPVRFAIDLAAFDGYVAAWQEADTGVLALADRFPSVAVTYDRVARGEGLADVQRFLGLDPVALRTDTVRGRTQRREEVVLNWDDVVSHLRGTPGEAWLDEDDLVSAPPAAAADGPSPSPDSRP